MHFFLKISITYISIKTYLGEKERRRERRVEGRERGGDPINSTYEVSKLRTEKGAELSIP